MSLETRKVLDMVAQGKITSEDAEKLLQKLGNSSVAAGEAQESANAPQSAPKRYLRIVVDEPGRKPVNIRMPLAFARAGMSMAGMLPKNVAEKLKEHGVDVGVFRLHGLGKDDDVEALEQLDLDIDKGDGKKIRIFCE
ncbi:MAG: SHOCT-like domain-containing protein [Terriglobales bacterium]